MTDSIPVIEELAAYCQYTTQKSRHLLIISQQTTQMLRDLQTKMKAVQDENAALKRENLLLYNDNMKLRNLQPEIQPLVEFQYAECVGCINNEQNQLGHMNMGGCLYMDDNESSNSSFADLDDITEDDF